MSILELCPTPRAVSRGKAWVVWRVSGAVQNMMTTWKNRGVRLELKEKFRQAAVFPIAAP